MDDYGILNKKIEAQDKIINEQVLEIARLTEWKEDLLNENIELENIRKEAIEYINTTDKWLCRVNDKLCVETIGKDKLLEILGDEENE